MINIIKHGKRKITKTFFRCTCSNCGCEFEVTSDEFESVAMYLFKDPLWKASVECPDCYVVFDINNRVQTREVEQEESIGSNYDSLMESGLI